MLISYEICIVAKTDIYDKSLNLKMVMQKLLCRISYNLWSSLCTYIYLAPNCAWVDDEPAMSLKKGFFG